MPDPALLAGIALKTSILVAAGAIASVALARKSAGCRHAVWASTLALSLIMPFAVAYLPVQARIAVPWPAVARSDRDATNVISPAASVASIAEITGSAAPRAREAWWSEGPAAHAFAVVQTALPEIWLVGAVALLLRAVLGQLALVRWTRSAHPLRSPRWAATLACVSAEQGLDRRLRVLECERAQSPCTWGCVLPVLLLPAAGDAWSEAQRRDSLRHELAHVRRHDYASTLVARFACALHWYNPLVWIVAAQARRLQEQACDDAVLRAGATPSDYAELLLRLAGDDDRGTRVAAAAIGMLPRSPLHDRVVAILDPRRERVDAGSLTLIAALLPLACLMLVLASCVAGTPQAVPVAADRGTADAHPRGTSDASVAESDVSIAEAASSPDSLAGSVASETPDERPDVVRVVHRGDQLAHGESVPAIPAVPAVRAIPADPAIPAPPAIPVVPAVPAIPAEPAVPATPADTAAVAGYAAAAVHW